MKNLFLCFLLSYVSLMLYQPLIASQPLETDTASKSNSAEKSKDVITDFFKQLPYYDHIERHGYEL